jgi:pyrroline-5-carboxylate reductase
MTSPASSSAQSQLPTIAFIGGGNMASSIIGGLIRQGHPVAQIEVVEPFAPTREALLTNYGLTALPEAGAALQRASIVVWAVKPQTFKDAAAQARAHTQQALHLSVAAGIRSDSIAQWLGTERIVRTMPNTPALVGKGMSALYARPAVGAPERSQVEAILASTGEFLWVESEKQLDAVTALSGSGPAYVFYFLEAMARAGTAMGLSAQQAHQLAVGWRAAPTSRPPCCASASPPRAAQPMLRCSPWKPAASLRRLKPPCVRPSSAPMSWATNLVFDAFLASSAYPASDGSYQFESIDRSR